MKHFKIFFSFIILFLGVTFISCRDDKGTDGIKEKTNYRRTVIVYMAAQNSLGNYSADISDSLEIANGTKFIPSTKDNLILFIDDKSKPRIYRYYNSVNGKVYYSKIFQYPTDVNSAGSSTLLDVLMRVKNLFPSKSYGLVMWSHGTGWIPQTDGPGRSHAVKSRKPQTFGIDVGEGGNMRTDTKSNGLIGDQMEISDLASAINQSGIHLDYIFFDVCMMQNFEVAYELRNVTDYIVASPVLTSVYGAYYYDQIRRGFFTYPTNDNNIRTIADTYYHNVMESDTTKQYYEYQDCVISVIKTSAIENLASQTALYLPKVIIEGREADLSAMDGYVDTESTGLPDCYDAAGVMHTLLSADDYAAWRKALDRCVIYHRIPNRRYIKIAGRYVNYIKVDPDIYCGASMFVPQNKYADGFFNINYNHAFRSTAWYAAAGWSRTGW